MSIGSSPEPPDPWNSPGIAARALLTSSGAVYGGQPPELTHVPEDYAGAPNTMSPQSAYGEGKRMAEHLGSLWSQRFGLEVAVARGFAFVGPYLPLDIHYAVGNFIRDGLHGGPILVQGDGTPCRSYLYAADLAVWLWTILLQGQSCRSYNVGSEEVVSIAELAHAVADCFDPRPQVRIVQTPMPGKPAERYVPTTLRARTELSLRQTIGLRSSIQRTIEFYRSRGQAERP